MEKQEVEILFRKHYRRMYAVAFGLLYDGQESKDAVSDVFASLLESDVELRPVYEEHYLVVAVRNRCLKRLRDKSNRERISRLYVTEQQVGEDWESDEHRLQALCRFAHEQLSPQDLALFTMRFVEGRDYKALCRVTGLSRVAVWKHLSHIMQLLKQHFNPTQQ